MTSPDFRTFVGTLIPGHSTWLTSHPTPSGTEFLDHYLGDPVHPDGLLWQYEAWRVEHGYVRVRAWNGSETLGRVPTVDIPSPGLVRPWISRSSPPAPQPAGPPFADTFLIDGTTTAQLQTHFGTGTSGLDMLGSALLDHWNDVRTFLTLNDSEISVESTAPYSIRFWGFMKWASVLRNRHQGIPVFAIPIVYDADGVPLSEIEYMDVANRWHTMWHRFSSEPACTQVTSQQSGNPFSPSESSFGQFCGRFGLSAEFLKFHRNVLDTYDKWRLRAGMPRVERWKPPQLHFHPDSRIPETQVSPQGLELSEDPATQENEIKSVVRYFNTVDALADYAEGDLHGAGHSAAESNDIGDPNTNNYSPRFMAWHRWIDHLWEKRQPRFESFRSVASDGTGFPGIVTVVRPTPNPDRVEPNNVVTGLTAAGLGSLWVKYHVRPETWGRTINLTISGEVYRNSSDGVPIAALNATPVTINSVTQGSDSVATELQFPNVDGDGDGAFANQSLPGGALGFKNGRVRISGKLACVGNISLPAGTSPIGGTSDDFDYTEHIDIILVKENRPPAVSTLLNKSSFSVDEVTVNAAGVAQSTFANSFFVVLQDPPEPPVGFATSSIFADPARTAVSGIFADTSIPPTVEVMDETGTNPVGWFTVALTDAFKEQPSLHDNISQRVLFRYLVIFNVGTISTLLPNSGDIRYARLRITARDRSGNTVQNVLSPPIKLFRDANPYMIDVKDDNPAWLSIDTRVFSVRHSELKFAHRVADSGGPNQYINDVIDEFNAGSQNFDTIPADQGQSQLELMPQVGGENVYNFTLARVRMKTQVPVSDVRTFFRLFTTAVSNLSFNAVNFPTSSGASPIALLGRTSPTIEIVSIPFFAEPRIESRDTMPGAVSMESQTDPSNVQSFAVTLPGGETIRYFGAYLDINSNTPRYPAAPVGNGPFPSSQCVSLRDIIRGQHQCMVAEVFYSGDPTEPNENPGTSDNLAQRNLIIVETVNPGINVTHTVQHSFDIVLADRQERGRTHEEVRRALLRLRKQRRKDDKAADEDVFSTDSDTFGALAALRRDGSVELQAVTGSRFDELLFFWNNLPRQSRVEVYMPSIDADLVRLFRRLRRAPETAKLVDDHTLLLDVHDGVTYLPIPNIGSDRVAGLLTITLPDAIKEGELYSVDVLQVRSTMSMVMGGFRVMIPVSKAFKIYPREGRVMKVFENRLALTPTNNRWYPILVKQVEYLRSRTSALAGEAADECSQAQGDEKATRIRVVVNKIKVLDYHGPLVHGSGQVALVARVTSTNTGGIGNTTRLPETGYYKVEERPDGFAIEVNKEIFRGSVKDNLLVEIFSGENEEVKHLCYYKRQFKNKAEGWIGTYRPGDEKRDPENVGDWQVWYSIEAI